MKLVPFKELDVGKVFFAPRFAEPKYQKADAKTARMVHSDGSLADFRELVPPNALVSTDDPE